MERPGALGQQYGTELPAGPGAPTCRRQALSSVNRPFFNPIK